MGAAILSFLGIIGSGIGGFFGFKQAQAQLVGSAIETVGTAAQADSNYAMASAEAIDALYQNGPPVERLWRPILMWIITFLIVARWFGYVPANIPHDEILNIYNWLEIGLIGYVPLRSVDKWMRGFQIGSVLKTMIEKKLM